MSRILDLTGEKYGFLKVIRMLDERRHGKVVWLCKCDCGNTTKVLSNNLRNGSTISCGCHNKKNRIRTKHGLCKSRIYNIYICIKERCCNPKSKSYKNYGLRGIDICEEWKQDFMSFYNWAIANGYSEELTIDRIDNNKGYAPDNCRWVNKYIQNNNTRRNRKIHCFGETHTVSEWAMITGINRNTINSRLNKGLSPEKILAR